MRGEQEKEKKNLRKVFELNVSIASKLMRLIDGKKEMWTKKKKKTNATDSIHVFIWKLKLKCTIV